ncbi:MAG: aryl-alcohol dehydrogenase-like predicted oxidoreductase [Patiriisocius sp.]|jgi:aryl-alcohol dehydrogenase-like predicted oxidoreductase
MEFKKLGNTDIDVSTICLGSMTWGEQNTEADAHEQLEYAISEGVNFIDTAEIYPVHIKEETQGRTESYIGNFLQKRGKRDDLIIASKVVGRLEHRTDLRGEPCRGSKKQILAAVDTSLARLQTDYIDLYQLHWPDRKTNFFGGVYYEHEPYDEEIEMEEQLDAMKDLIAAGKIRHVGLSNETPWGIMHALELSRTKGLPRIQTVQNPYNFIQRTWDVGCSEVAIRENVGLLAYSPLAGGVLSGKYRNGQNPEGSRKLHFPNQSESRYHCERAYVVVEKYAKLAEDNNMDLATLSLAYVNQHPSLSANIIGATTMEQLKTNIASIDTKLSPEVLAEVRSIFFEDSVPFNLGTWN